jgi:hypothetical protein
MMMLMLMMMMLKKRADTVTGPDEILTELSGCDLCSCM